MSARMPCTGKERCDTDLFLECLEKQHNLRNGPDVRTYILVESSLVG